MDFSQADSAAETTFCPFLSFHYIYDLFINKTRKKILQAQFCKLPASLKTKAKCPTHSFPHQEKYYSLLYFCRGLCSRSVTDNFLWTSYSHVPVHRAKPNPVTKQAQWREQHTQPLTFPVITKGSSTLTMPHNSSKTPLPKALSW